MIRRVLAALAIQMLATGAAGAAAFAPASDSLLAVPEDGIFPFESILIPEEVTVSFQPWDPAVGPQPVILWESAGPAAIHGSLLAAGWTFQLQAPSILVTGLLDAGSLILISGGGIEISPGAQLVLHGSTPLSDEGDLSLRGEGAISIRGRTGTPFVDWGSTLTPAPAIPEPGNAFLILAGLGVLAWRRSGRHTAGRITG